jgi:ubiquinone/menaquinone biosynthesis C-methylase UbiE
MAQPWNLKKKGYKERSKRLPLFAPIKSEQKIYEKYIKKVPKNSNALVLGATPEPRDLALKNGLKTYAVDISRDMLKKYTALMKYENHPNNIQKTGNWLDMKFKKGYFNIIMGDASFNNLATRKQNARLLGKLKSMLAPNGFLVLRQFFKPQLRPIPIKRLVKLYRSRKISFSDFFGELRLVFPMNKIYNKKTFQFKADEAFYWIDRKYKEGLLNKQERESIFVYKNSITNTAYLEKKFIKLADIYGFKPIETFADKRFRITKFLKMCVFRKR